jgi:hypothetical protein
LDRGEDVLRHAGDEIGDRAPDVLLRRQAVHVSQGAVHADESQVRPVECQAHRRRLEDRVQERQGVVAGALGLAQRADVLEDDDADRPPSEVRHRGPGHEEVQDTALQAPLQARAADALATCDAHARQLIDGQLPPAAQHRTADQALADRAAREAASGELVGRGVGVRDLPRPRLQEHDGDRQQLQHRLEVLAIHAGRNGRHGGMRRLGAVGSSHTG